MAPHETRKNVKSRPSSSSGTTGLGEFKREDYDKRKSRDDLYLLTRKDKPANFRAFHVPLRNRLPSPEVSPSDKTITQGFPTLRIATPDSFGDQHCIAVVNIGMALGSPAHPPPPAANWQPQPWNPSMSSEPPPDEAKPKQRKWSLFRSKSKRARGESSPLPKSEHVLTITSPVGAKPGDKGHGGVLGRSDSTAQHFPKHKPIVIRSQTEPSIPSQQRTASGPLVRPAPKANPYDQRQRSLGSQAHHLPAVNKPLLNVEIPDITLERYSVMFNQVLHNSPQGKAAQHPRQSPMSPQRHIQQCMSPISPKSFEQQSRAVVQKPLPVPQRKPSLLARRQATLERLKTEDDLAELKPPPKKPAQGPKHSPSFCLFPATPGRTAAPLSAPRSPRARANTSPAFASSPSQAIPEQPAKRKESIRSQSYPLASPEPAPAKGPPSAQRRPQLSSRFSKLPSASASPVLLLESPVTVEIRSPVVIKEKLRPALEEPKREMVKPAASSQESLTVKKEPLSSKVSSEQISVFARPEKTTEEKAAERALRDAVQKSITRQISVSREQRQLLGRLGSQSKSDRKEMKPVSIKQITVGKNERLAETNTKTPTIVHPETPTGLAIPKSMHTRQRSERAVVEGV